MFKTMEHAIGNQFRFKTPNTGGWQDRHHAAWFNPRKGSEVRIVRLIEALALYAANHEHAEDGGIGSDGYCGEYWLDMMRAARKLLSADLGRLDGGTLDGLLFDMAEAAGFKREDFDA
jgi:hypothetical protein